MAGREHGVTGVEGVLRVQLLEAISVKERWQREFQLPATKVPKTEVDMRRIWARGFPSPAMKVPILQVGDGRSMGYGASGWCDGSLTSAMGSRRGDEVGW